MPAARAGAAGAGGILPSTMAKRSGDKPKTWKRGRTSMFPGKTAVLPASVSDEAKATAKAQALEVPCTVSDFIEGLIRFHGRDAVATLRRLRDEQRGR